MLVQINKDISTKGYKRDQFTGEVKNRLAETFNYQRNWGKAIKFDNIISFYQFLIENLNAYRFGIKEKSNSKKDAKNEIWAIALDLDCKPNAQKGIIGCSIKRTLEFARDYSHIFYLSPSGVDGEDTTPHRLILAFNEPQTIEIAEQYISYLSLKLQGESICKDATRLWFPPLESTIHLSKCQIGKGLEELILPTNQTQKSIKVAHQENNDNKINNNSISSKINLILTKTALEMGFEDFFKTINIQDVIIKKSNRIPENGTIDGIATERFDVKPIDSNCEDRVTANLIDDILYFYDRKEGSSGYSGTFLKFLHKCAGGNNNDFKSLISYSKQLFELLKLEYIDFKDKKIEASNLWYSFLNDNSENLIYIQNSQNYGFFNGRYWELLTPEELIDRHFINWVIPFYGIIKASTIGAIKNNIKNVTFDLVKSYKTIPIERELYGFQDGVFNVINKTFSPFSNSFFIWNLSEFSFNETNLERGKIAYEKLGDLIKGIIIGDSDKHKNFLNGFSLMVLDNLWKTQSMLWLYGEGGAGKSTFTNWIRDMLGSSIENGRVSDLRSNELFNSPHSLQKIIQGSIINLSEFSFPSASDAAFLKDLIASGATENSDKMRGGCAIPINEKYKQPYTAFWIGSIVATSQEKPTRDCILDSGWVRRINFFSTQKIKETTTLFKEIDSLLGELFVYILHLDVDSLIKEYNDYFRTPNIKDQQALELELSPVASFLNDYCIPSKTPVAIKVFYQEFHGRKQLYGWPNNYSLSLSKFEKYLSRYLQKFYSGNIYLDENGVTVCDLTLKSITTSNGGFSYD